MKFFDDIRVGEVSDLGRHTFTAEDIKSFAARFDPQRFHARELPRDGKAEPGATVALRGRGVCLREFLEQFGLLLRRHPNAGVAYGEFDPIAPVSDPAYPQGDLALSGEFAAIAQEIQENLFEPHARDTLALF